LLNFRIFLTSGSPFQSAQDEHLKQDVLKWHSFFYFEGGTFENISVSATTATENGILLRGATTFLNKVHVSGFRTGVKVMPGAALVARRCEIFGEQF